MSRHFAALHLPHAHASASAGGAGLDSHALQPQAWDFGSSSDACNQLDAVDRPDAAVWTSRRRQQLLVERVARSVRATPGVRGRGEWRESGAAPRQGWWAVADKLHAAGRAPMPMAPSSAAATAAAAASAHASAAAGLEQQQQQQPLDAGAAAEAWRVAFFRSGGDVALRSLLAVAVDPQQGGIQADQSSSAIESERVGRALALPTLMHLVRLCLSGMQHNALSAPTDESAGDTLFATEATAAELERLEQRVERATDSAFAAAMGRAYRDAAPLAAASPAARAWPPANARCWCSAPSISGASAAHVFVLVFDSHAEAADAVLRAHRERRWTRSRS